MMGGAIDSFLSKQFAIWAVVFTVAFSVATYTLYAFGVGAIWAFVVGVVFGDALNYVRRWLYEWYEAEREAAHV